MGKEMLKLDYIKAEFAKRGYVLLTSNYVNCDQRLEYTCPKGHRHRINWSNWKKGHGCPYCAGQGKPDINQIRSFFESEGYRLISDSYVNDDSKLWYICPHGHVHAMRWGNFRHGKRCPQCSRIQSNLKVSGQNHYNWKGGITRFNKELRNFVKHIGWTESVFRRDSYTCIKCGTRGGHLVAHHILPLSFIRDKFKLETTKDVEKCELVYDISNGITLCRKCHKLIHDKFYVRRRNVLCLNQKLVEPLSGLYEPFVKEILRRNPSNSGEALTDNAVGNPERSPKGNVQRLERKLVGSSESKRGRPEKVLI